MGITQDNHPQRFIKAFGVCVCVCACGACMCRSVSCGDAGVAGEHKFEHVKYSIITLTSDQRLQRFVDEEDDVDGLQRVAETRAHTWVEFVTAGH